LYAVAILILDVAISGFQRAPANPPTAGAGVAAARTIIPYADAKSIFETLRADLLPPELRVKRPIERQVIWKSWVTRRDVAIRARLARGDEESIVSFLVFGTTFTNQPRIADHDAPTEPAAVTKMIEARLNDLMMAVGSPRANDRLQFVRRVLARKGINPGTSAGRAQARRYLAGLLSRASEEAERFNRLSQSLQDVRDPRVWSEKAAPLFRERGLISDTSILPNFAIDQALRAIKSERSATELNIRRVAIVGPGLDFTDKEAGYDFYPQQTLQPFAIVDSLIRLGLANAGELRVTTFDVSPTVNKHLEDARQRARGGEGYPVQLLRDDHDQWSDPLIEYWRQFGTMIGEETPPVPVPSGLATLQNRAVKVRPSVVMSVTPLDVNIVLQRWAPLPPEERWDLIIATSVLVYYDLFEQSLALTNVASMLRPGGLFLSSDLTFELPATPMKLVGFTDVRYTDAKTDRVAWFQLR
jgi:hypothetical protein